MFLDEFTTQVQILSTLKLSDITPKFRTAAMFLIVSIHKITYIICKNVYDLSSYKISCSYLSNGPLVVAVKLKAKLKFHKAAILLF
jgi:hypothetical protein